MNALLILGMLNSQFVEQGVYRLADYIDVERDCLNGTRCDLSPGFDQALAECRALPQEAFVADGCRFEVPRGLFRLTRPLELCRRHIIEGRGNSLRGPQTVIQATGTAVHMRGSGFCSGANLGNGGGTRLAHLALYGPVERTGPPTYGVFMERTGYIDHVEIRGFTVGVRIDADVTREPPSNSNIFRLHGVDVNGSAFAAIWSSGGDSNAGMISASSFASSCVHGTAFSAQFGVPCANVIDRSFLGNTYVGIHTATARDRDTTERFPGFDFTGLSQRNVCLGCYAESDQLTNIVSVNSNAIGGLSGWTGDGQWLQGRRMNTLELTNTPDRAEETATRLMLGEAAGPDGGVMRAFTGDAPSPLSLQWDERTGSWRYDIGHLDAAVALRIFGLEPRSGELELPGLVSSQ